MQNHYKRLANCRAKGRGKNTLHWAEALRNPIRGEASQGGRGGVAQDAIREGNLGDDVKRKGVYLRKKDGTYGLHFSSLRCWKERDTGMQFFQRNPDCGKKKGLRRCIGYRADI